MDRLTVALVFTLASCLAFATICLGILRGGFYRSWYVFVDSTNEDWCLLGLKDPEEYYGDVEEHPEVCRLGLAVAYLSIILSLLMLCEESLRRNTTPTHLRSIFPTMKILFSIAMGLLWLASSLYSLWVWITLNGSLKGIYYRDTDLSSIRAAASFYIIFHFFSVVSWGCLAVLIRRRMMSTFLPDADETANNTVTFHCS
jgi:hypothetical protein